MPPSHHHFSFQQQHLHRTIFHNRGTVSWFVLDSLRLEANKTCRGNEHICCSPPTPVLLNSRRFGGYARVRVGEAVNHGPATHERDWTDEQPDPTHKRINKAGDSVPSTRAVQKTATFGLPSGCHDLTSPPLPTMGNPRKQSRPKQQPREHLRCAQCGSDRAAHIASSDHGLMLHTGQKHGGERLLPESIGQMRHLDSGACVMCGATRSRRCDRCNSCNGNTPLRELRVGDTLQDLRQPGHQEARPLISNRFRARSQCLQPLDDSPLPPHPEHRPDRSRQAIALRAPPGFGVGTPALCGLTMRHGLGRKPRRSHERSEVLGLALPLEMSLLLAVIPKSVDRNSELKRRLHLWESGQINALIGLVLGQQNSGPLRKTAGKPQPQTHEQRGRRACVLTARGSISKATKGLVGGAADCRRNWTTALIPRSSGTGTHPTSVECVEAA